MLALVTFTVSALTRSKNLAWSRAELKRDFVFCESKMLKLNYRLKTL